MCETSVTFHELDPLLLTSLIHPAETAVQYEVGIG